MQKFNYEVGQIYKISGSPSQYFTVTSVMKPEWDPCMNYEHSCVGLLTNGAGYVHFSGFDKHGNQNMSKYDSRLVLGELVPNPPRDNINLEAARKIARSLK